MIDSDVGHHADTKRRVVLKDCGYIFLKENILVLCIVKENLLVIPLVGPGAETGPLSARI